jgi:hypothetical protein
MDAAGMQFAPVRVDPTQCSVAELAHYKGSKPMVRTISKTCGIALASLCLASTLAMAQPAAPGQTMTCTKVDASGYCVEAKAKDDKVITIRTEGVKVGESVNCTTTGTSTTCTKVTTVK